MIMKLTGVGGVSTFLIHGKSSGSAGGLAKFDLPGVCGFDVTQPVDVGLIHEFPP